jgi:hypothetical protein
MFGAFSGIFRTFGEIIAHLSARASVSKSTAPEH